MNPLAIALQGVGYAALVLGLQGFAAVDEAQVIYGGRAVQSAPDLRELLLSEDELLILFVTSFTPMLR
jgi:hypothetical protein